MVSADTHDSDLIVAATHEPTIAKGGDGLLSGFFVSTI
jgi:hypothetical protein